MMRRASFFTKRRLIKFYSTNITIYPPNHSLIPGITYIPNYLTKEEHDECVQSIKEILTKYPPFFSHYDQRGIVNLFGKKLQQEMQNYKTLHQILSKTSNDFMNTSYDCIQINNYLPQGGCPRHVDAKSIGQVICMLSFLSPAVMDFLLDPPPNVSQDEVEKMEPELQILMEPASLMVLKDDARWKYLHGVKVSDKHKIGEKEIQKEERISLVFWKMK